MRHRGGDDDDAGFGHESLLREVQQDSGRPKARPAQTVGTYHYLVADGTRALVATVVIPARDAAQLIGTQLDALAAQDVAGPFEVVVSDNGSSDDTAGVALARAADFAALRVVDASQHPGVSHARNIGAMTSRAPVVLFCDADDAADPGWISAMVRALENADLVGGPLEAERLSEPGSTSWRHLPPDDALPVTMRFLPYATGANLGVRAALFRTLDGFDTSYVGGHEEVDFAWRAQLAGHDAAFVPDAVMHYRLRRSVPATMRQMFGYGRSYAQLFKRFRDQPIPRTPWRREVRTYLILAVRGVRAVRRRDAGWLGSAAWTVGRLYGDLRYGVRCPL